MKKTKPAPFVKEALTWRHLFYLLGVLVFFLLLRWNSFTTPFERDEGEYAYAATLLLNGGMPYEQSFLQKPPMIVYVYLLSQLISKDSIVLPRILASLSVFLTILIAGIIASRERGNFTGFTVMWLAVPLFSLPQLFPFAANTEVFMVLPMMVVFFLFMRKKAEATSLEWFIAGCCGAIACLFKPIAAPVLVFIVLVWQYESWKSTKRFSTLLTHTGAVLLGVMVTSAVVLLPFLFHDGGKTFRECVIDYNVLYNDYFENDATPLLVFLTLFWKKWWVVCLLFGWFIIKRPQFWWGYLGIIIISLLTIFRILSGHYYIMLLPFVAIISTISLDLVIKQLKTSYELESKWFKFSFVTGIIFLLSLPNLNIVTKSPQELSAELYSINNPFIEAPTLAKKIQENSQASDNIFIAGSEPELLYYANRESSSRFVIVYPLMIPTSVAGTYQQVVVQTLQQNLPQIIVYVQSNSSWLKSKKSPELFVTYIDRLVKTNYTLIGGTLFDRKEWIDSPNEQEKKRCSMLLYKLLPTGG